MPLKLAELIELLMFDKLLFRPLPVDPLAIAVLLNADCSFLIDSEYLRKCCMEIGRVADSKCDE